MSRLGQILRMGWLWSIFAGFYLVAYVFWVPRLLASPVEVILAAALTLLIALSLLCDGFSSAIALQGGSALRVLPFRRLRRFAGGGLLLAYLLVYIQPQGRIVAHWPLDLAITAVSGAVMVVYGIQNQ